MKAANFECQIARGQLNRYLSGEHLQSETLRQLGAHVGECLECQDYLEKRRDSLQKMLPDSLANSNRPNANRPRANADLLTQAIVNAPKERSRPQSVQSTFLEVLQSKASEDAGIPTPSQEDDVAEVTQTPSGNRLSSLLNSAGPYKKPALYGGMLLVVLVGMRVISANPTGFLGPKAFAAESGSTKIPSTDGSASKNGNPVAPKLNSNAASSPVAPPAKDQEINESATAPLKASPNELSTPSDPPKSSAPSPKTSSQQNAADSAVPVGPLTRSVESKPPIAQGATTKVKAKRATVKQAARRLKKHAWKRGSSHRSATAIIRIYNP